MLVSIGGAIHVFHDRIEGRQDQRCAARLPLPWESRDEPKYVVGSPKIVSFIEFSLTGHSVDAACGVKLQDSFCEPICGGGLCKIEQAIS